VELTLVDFLLGGRAERVDGVTVRGRPGVFTDSRIRRAFFGDFVRPFLGEFGRSGALFGIDCVNEPEWLVSKREGGNWEDVDAVTRAVESIPRAALDAFLADCAAAVAQVAPQLTVTAGTSVRNLPLSARAGEYSAVHHYPYMGRLDSFAKDLPTNRPWVLEELPTSDEEYAKSRRAGGPGDLGGYLTTARRLGSAGALLWSLNPGADDATVSLPRFDSRLRELRAWCGSHAGTFCAPR
jgi:hypothetical protein